MLVNSENKEEIIDLLKKSIDSIDEIHSIEIKYKMGRKLLDSPDWPLAVEEHLIVDESSEVDKLIRAEGILDILNESFIGKKFLDFGCGTGHVALKASEKAALSIGYDIEPQWTNINNSNRLILTDNYDLVKDNGPYDIILLYDVLDHLEEDPVDILLKIRDLLSDNGVIYVRTHPFSSRHATHLYRQINKAYVHLVFSEEELESMGYKWMKTKKVVSPILTYAKWFSDAKLKMKFNVSITKEPVEEFFKNGEVAQRIMGTMEKNEFPQFQLEQQFHDYALVKQ